MSDDERVELNAISMGFIEHDWTTTKDNICLIQAVKRADFFGCEVLRAAIVETLEETYRPKGQKLNSMRREAIFLSIYKTEIAKGATKEDAYRKIIEISSKPNQTVFGSLERDAVYKTLQTALKRRAKNWEKNSKLLPRTDYDD